MPHSIRHLVIDGNCLIYRDPDLAGWCRDDFPAARRALVRSVSPLADALADRTTMVFDGSAGTGGPADGFESTGVAVVFSSASESADTVIERMAVNHEGPGFCVVTSDRMIIDLVTAAGGQALSCRQFLENKQERGTELRRTLHRRPPSNKRNTLGDYFP